MIFVYTEACNRNLDALFEFAGMYDRSLIVFVFFPISIITDELDSFPQWQDLECQVSKLLS